MKKFITMITKGKRLELVFYIILVLVLLFFFSFSELVDITTFSTVVIASAVSFLVGILGKWLYNKVEDSVKLTENYKSLVDKYNMVEKIKYENHKGVAVFPVAKVADLYDCPIVVSDEPDNAYEPESIITNHYSEILASHKTSEVYNNYGIRINDWYFNEDGSFEICTGRTTYFHSLVTNRAMDFVFDNKLTIREVYECGPFLTPLKCSQLSNHLGFNGFVESSDGYVAFVKRGKNVSVGKSTVGPSVSASMKVKYALDSNMVLSADGLYNGMICEIRDELNVSAESVLCIDGSRVKVICAYRDLVEGGKPQLLFYAKSSKTKRQIENDFIYKKIHNNLSLRNVDLANTEYEEYKFKSKAELRMIQDGDHLLWIHVSELLNADTEIYPEQMIVSGSKYKMLPTISACVVMFVNWLKNNDGRF